MEYQLHENQPLRLEHAAGQRIECRSGTAWITAYGLPTDFMLRAGQSFEVPNDGLTLIEAIGRSSITIHQRRDRPGRWARLVRACQQGLTGNHRPQAKRRRPGPPSGPPASPARPG